mmetsp:Transcript_47791/g.134964  ORF Transcript_47791/g.134964 Transcript_47791/m.134964 type:complete len:280 (+) Transcript_47791:63-902(+)
MRLIPFCGLAHPQDEGSIETILFVDVDGVLNVGIEDPGKKSVSFNDVNVQKALRMRGASQDVAVPDMVEKILSIYEKEVGHGEGSTYAEFTSSEIGVCDKMVERFAQIIKTAGDNCIVVLTSSWRHPRHVKDLQQLELAVHGNLGKNFTFHHRTALVHDNSPEKRLHTIGEFIATKGSQIFRSSRKWRVLVLEDFHVNAIDGWLCDGMPIDSAITAEKYLLNRMPSFIEVSVKLIHTFSTWTTPSGLTVRIGTGLTKEHYCKAMKFLGNHNCDYCMRAL